MRYAISHTRGAARRSQPPSPSARRTGLTSTWTSASARGPASATFGLHVRLLLVTPPMTQLNTPYPATAYLMGFLRQHEARLGLELAQADAALELFLRLFSRAGLERVLDELSARTAAAGGEAGEMPPSLASLLAHG